MKPIDDNIMNGNKEIRKLLLYINDTPKLQSLLYDMDLLPEQCEHGSRDWRNMLLLAERWKNSTMGYGKGSAAVLISHPDNVMDIEVSVPTGWSLGTAFRRKPTPMSERLNNLEDCVREQGKSIKALEHKQSGACRTGGPSWYW